MGRNRLGAPCQGAWRRCRPGSGWAGGVGSDGQSGGVWVTVPQTRQVFPGATAVSPPAPGCMRWMSAPSPTVSAGHAGRTAAVDTGRGAGAASAPATHPHAFSGFMGLIRRNRFVHSAWALRRCADRRPDNCRLLARPIRRTSPMHHRDEGAMRSFRRSIGRASIGWAAVPPSSRLVRRNASVKYSARASRL